jgi:hypothetical protein
MFDNPEYYIIFLRYAKTFTCLSSSLLRHYSSLAVNKIFVQWEERRRIIRCGRLILESRRAVGLGCERPSGIGE